MSRFHGYLGFAKPVETRPGVWSSEDTVIEKKCSGDLIRSIRRLDNGSSINDDISLTNEFSIVLNPYIYENFHAIKYITYMGTRWEVQTATIDHPRLTLTTGGVYNGPTPSTS